MTLVKIGHQVKEAESDRQTDVAIESSEEFIHHSVTESGTETTFEDKRKKSFKLQNFN